MLCYPHPVADDRAVGGDLIFNPMFMQQKQMDMQKEMSEQQGADPNDPANQGQQEFSDEEQDPETEEDPQQSKPDPITKAFCDYLTQMH